MSTYTHDDGSDQTADFRTREKFICNLCGFEFNEDKYLKNHFKHCQDIENPGDRLGAGIVAVKTEDCTEELQQCLKLDEHVTSKETFDIKVEDMIFTEYTVSGLNCKVSDPPMEQQSTELEEHTKIPKGGNPCVSNICDSVTTKPKHLTALVQRHAVRKHHKSNTWDGSNRNLLSHKTRRRRNTENKPLKCSRCDYISSRNADLTSHMRTHTGEKPFKCTRCDYACAIKTNLRSHMIVHTGQKLFKCTTCDYASGRSAGLASHMRTHTGEKPFKCTRCDYACTQPNSLIGHMRTHTGEKPFKCTICDYACAMSSSLSRHMRIHTGDKPFKCTRCDYASSMSSSLSRHMRIHSGEKPFKCTRCDYACAISFSLTRHMRTFRHT